MFELGIFCVILFAIAYWSALFIMGRRDDVLHGEFIRAESELASAPAGAPTGITPAESVPAPAVTNPDPAAPPVIAAAPARAVEAPARRAGPVKKPVNPEKLQALLASIKQELKNAAQI